MIATIIQKKLNQVISILKGETIVCNPESFKQLKGQLSGKVVAEKLGLNEQMFREFETALNQYFKFRDDPVSHRISCFRVSLWLETICKNLNIPFSLEEEISNERIAIKQVRALELILRDLVRENLGGRENVLTKIQEIFKQEMVQKWIRNADDTGVLSGTTFSELANIFLHKNIFISVEEIFNSSKLKISKSNRNSLRYILEDIRLIRNSIAHNKKISAIQMDALNEYYNLISNLIKDSQVQSLNPDVYLDIENENIESILLSIQADNKSISTDISSMKTDLRTIGVDTKSTSKRTRLILAGSIILILLTIGILYSISKQGESAIRIEEGVEASNQKIDKVNKSLELNFEKIEQLILSQNEIKAPSTPNDFIANAYFFKMGGDEVRSLESFEKFLEISKQEKVDVYLDYFDVLASVKGKNYAIAKFSGMDSEIANLVILMKDTKTMDEFLLKAKSIKLSDELSCVCNFWNYSSARWGVSKNFNNPMLKTALRTYSTCQKFEVLDGLYSQIDFLFLNKSQIEDFLKSDAAPFSPIEFIQTSISGLIIDSDTSLDNLESIIGYKKMVQDMLSGQESELIFNSEGDLIDYTKVDSEDYKSYLKILQQFCDDYNINLDYLFADL